MLPFSSKYLEKTPCDCSSSSDRSDVVCLCSGGRTDSLFEEVPLPDGTSGSGATAPDVGRLKRSSLMSAGRPCW